MEVLLVCELPLLVKEWLPFHSLVKLDTAFPLKKVAKRLTCRAENMTERSLEWLCSRKISICKLTYPIHSSRHCELLYQLELLPSAEVTLMVYLETDHLKISEDVLQFCDTHDSSLMNIQLTMKLISAELLGLWFRVDFRDITFSSSCSVMDLIRNDNFRPNSFSRVSTTDFQWDRLTRKSEFSASTFAMEAAACFKWPPLHNLVLLQPSSRIENANNPFNAWDQLISSQSESLLALDVLELRDAQLVDIILTCRQLRSITVRKLSSGAHLLELHDSFKHIPAVCFGDVYDRMQDQYSIWTNQPFTDLMEPLLNVLPTSPRTLELDTFMPSVLATCRRFHSYCATLRELKLRPAGSFAQDTLVNTFSSCVVLERLTMHSVMKTITIAAISDALEALPSMLTYLQVTLAGTFPSAEEAQRYLEAVTRFKPSLQSYKVYDLRLSLAQHSELLKGNATLMVCHVDREVFERAEDGEEALCFDLCAKYLDQWGAVMRDRRLSRVTVLNEVTNGELLQLSGWLNPVALRRFMQLGGLRSLPKLDLSAEKYWAEAFLQQFPHLSEITADNFGLYGNQLILCGVNTAPAVYHTILKSACALRTIEELSFTIDVGLLKLHQQTELQLKGLKRLSFSREGTKSAVLNSGELGGFLAIYAAQLRDISFSLCNNCNDEALRVIASKCPALQQISLSRCKPLSWGGISRFVSSASRVHTIKLEDCVADDGRTRESLSKMLISRGGKLVYS